MSLCVCVCVLCAVCVCVLCVVLCAVCVLSVPLMYGCHTQPPNTDSELVDLIDRSWAADSKVRPSFYAIQVYKPPPSHHADVHTHTITGQPPDASRPDAATAAARRSSPPPSSQEVLQGVFARYVQGQQKVAAPAAAAAGGPA